MSTAIKVNTMQASESSASNALYYLTKAQAATKEGNHLLVLENLLMAYKIEPDEIEILAAIVGTQVSLEHWKQVLPMLDLLIHLQPDELEWHITKLRALHSDKAYEKVITGALSLVEAHPNEEKLLSLLASAYYQSDNFPLGLKTIQTLIDLYPDKPDHLAVRGLIYMSMGDKERGKIDLLKAESLGDSSVVVFSSLGAFYAETYEYAIALSYYSQALAVIQEVGQAPQLALNASFSAMCLGDFDKAWQFYAYRKYSSVKAETVYPAWQGEDLSGMHLVVRREQGLGDELRFSSVVAEIASEAKLVTLECDPRLVDLYQRSFPNNVTVLGINKIDHETAQVNNYLDVDFAAHIGDLSHYKRRSLDDFPEHYGWLKPDSKRVSYWSDYLHALGGKLNVGVTWKSGNTLGIRNTIYTAIEHWLPVFGIEGINFVNLYYGDSEEELKWVEAAIGVKVHTPKGIDLKNDLDDLSALMASLDLVVGPHTAPVDMAMGVEGASAWLLPFRPFSSKGSFYFGQAYYPWAPAAKPIYGDGFEKTMDVVEQELSHIVQTTEPKLILAELSKIMYVCYGAS